MTLWRWLRNEQLGFPQPIRINGRRFWSEEALSAWERTQGAQQAVSRRRYKPEVVATDAAEVKIASGSEVRS
jgi:hypothetical protein